MWGNMKSRFDFEMEWVSILIFFLLFQSGNYNKVIISKIYLKKGKRKNC